MKRQRGFTLIELMVVIAIIAILSTMMIGVSSRPYGANARVISEQLVSTLGLARLRAASTRKTHRVVIAPNQVAIYVAATTATDPTGHGLAAVTAWETVPIQQLTIPKSVKLWNAAAGANPNPGATPAQNAALSYAIDFRPDGQATASTVFVTDTAQKQKWRVIVYPTTGGAYSREYW